jgi:hypothetical protein
LYPKLQINIKLIEHFQGAVAALHFMITNAAKHDVDEVSLVQEIQQLGLPKENSENIGRAYKDHKEALRHKFAEESYQLSKLISADWRVDQLVASSDRDEATGPIVQLKFEVDTRPQDGTVDGNMRAGRVQEFACELSGGKLDVLIAELAKAQAILQTIQT